MPVYQECVTSKPACQNKFSILTVLINLLGGNDA